MGLYGGLTVDAIKEKKGLGEDDLLDRAGATELAANLFRITQTDAKLKKEPIHGEDQASNVHRHVGQQVRETIGKIGGTMPEDLPAEEHIKNLTQRQLGKLPKEDEKLEEGGGEEPTPILLP
jgi:DNA-damage-inducible protein D